MTQLWFPAFHIVPQASSLPEEIPKHKDRNKTSEPPYVGPPYKINKK